MAHYEEVAVRGYEEFCKAVSERAGKDIFAYFSGDKDAQGKSWCPDCVKGKTYFLILQPPDSLHVLLIDFYSTTEN